VTVIFKDGTDIYFARQQRAHPGGAEAARRHHAAMGPISTGLGEIYLWTVEAEEGARKPDGALHADRPARDPGLDHQAAAAQRAGRDRDQLHRRLAKEYQVAPSRRSWPPMA
jgi:Cu/Ag efflux pump CusA